MKMDIAENIKMSLRRRLQLISLITMALMTVTTGCEKEIDFEYKEIDPILVIEGALTQNGAEVSLTFTTPMNEPFERTRLTDATVSVSDLTVGNDSRLFPDETGVYRSDLRGETGHEYLLTVDREGKRYTSVSVMGGCVDITGMEFSWIKMPYDDVAALQVSFRDNPEETGECYWLRVYRNGEAYKWAEINDLLSSDGIINEVMMTTRRDLEEEDESDILEDGDVVTATVAPIERGMYDYLEALSVGNSNGPRMFEGDICLGYFLAAPVTERSVVFRLQ